MIKSKQIALTYVLLFSMLICTIFFHNSQVYASSILDDVNDSNITDEELVFAEDTEYSLTRGNNLNYGTTRITKLSSTKLNMYGVTQAHQECESLELYLYLERKVNGSYSTYKSFRYTAADTYSMQRSINVIVPSGYYRIRGYHAAVDGGTRESVTTLTNGIYIG